MKQASLIALVIAGGVASSTAQAADLNSTLKTSALLNAELVFSLEQLTELGVATERLVDANGRSIAETSSDLIKVEMHEEEGFISFSSFDDCARRIDLLALTQQPRNAI